MPDARQCTLQSEGFSAPNQLGYAEMHLFAGLNTHFLHIFRTHSRAISSAFTYEMFSAGNNSLAMVLLPLPLAPAKIYKVFISVLY